MCMGPRIMQTTDEELFALLGKCYERAVIHVRLFPHCRILQKQTLKIALKTFFKAIFKFFTAIKIVCKADL